MARLVSRNTYLKKKTALQIQNRYRGNKKVGYKVVKVNLTTKKLKPKTLKTFKNRANAQKYAKGY